MYNLPKKPDFIHACFCPVVSRPSNSLVSGLCGMGLIVLNIHCLIGSCVSALINGTNQRMYTDVHTIVVSVCVQIYTSVHIMRVNMLLELLVSLQVVEAAIKCCQMMVFVQQGLPCLRSQFIVFFCT